MTGSFSRKTLLHIVSQSAIQSVVS